MCCCTAATDAATCIQDNCGQGSSFIGSRAFCSPADLTTYYSSVCHAYCHGVAAPVACVRTAQCYPVSDIVFLFDTSTSVENAEMGGHAGAFKEMISWAAALVRAFGTSIAQQRVRVAALTFATTAQVQFNFGSGESSMANTRNAGNVADALAGIRYDDSGSQDTLSYKNIHLALAVMQSQLLSPSMARVTGFRQHAVPLHIVLLTDGKPHNEGMWGNTLLSSELKSSVYARPNVHRWVVETGADVDAESVRTLASSQAHVGRLSSQQTAKTFRSTVTSDDQVCDTTSVETTTTTTPTSTPCHEIRADLVLMIDSSASVSASSATSATTCKGLLTNEDVVRQFLVDTIATLAPHINDDGIRVAAVVYSSTARVEFEFTTRAGIIKSKLKSMELRPGAPTLAHTALDTARTRLLRSGGNTRFRHRQAPVMIVFVSDGSSLLGTTANPAALQTALAHDMCVTYSCICTCGCSVAARWRMHAHAWMLCLHLADAVHPVFHTAAWVTAQRQCRSHLYCA